jgi:hypothetical protein
MTNSTKDIHADAAGEAKDVVVVYDESGYSSGCGWR